MIDPIKALHIKPNPGTGQYPRLDPWWLAQAPRSHVAPRHPIVQRDTVGDGIISASLEGLGMEVRPLEDASARPSFLLTAVRFC